MVLVNQFTLYLLVFLLAATPFFEVIAVVPIAIIGGMPAIPVAILGFVGNALTIVLLVALIERFKKWRKNRSGEESNTKRRERAVRLWNKYGMPGLALIGPFFVGSHLSALMGISLGGEKRLVTQWMLISLALWTTVSALAAYNGIKLFAFDDAFLSKYFQN